MNNYKVMLVDDEDEVRQAIERRVNWAEMGFCVVATAENGEEALEKAEKYQPDVVMSDIHMPFMDGLTFCRKLKDQFPGTKIIIFSGYDEFEYAKEAIRLEAEEYILKPIDAEELKKVFVKIKNRLDEEYDRRRNIETLEKYYNESLPILREQLLIGILEGRINENEMAKYLSEYGINLDSAFYTVSIIDPGTSPDKNNQIMAVSLKQIVDEQFSKSMGCVSINYLGRLIVIGELKSTSEYQKFVNLNDQICKLASKILEVSVFAGIGKVVGQIKDLSVSFAEAEDALSYKILLDDNQAILIQDVEPGYSKYAEFGDADISELLKNIKIGSKEELSSTIEIIINKLKRSTAPMHHIQLYFVEIYVGLMRLARSYELSDDQLTELDRDIYMETRNLNSIEELRDWLLNICLQLRGFIRKERQDTTKLLVEKAKEYISEKYTDSALSLDAVCNYLSVSPTYFSSMFKKDTGVSFVTYITNIRMEKAVHLLESTSEKSYIIAGMVGYDDPNYFSYVFKKAYGISPSKYRNKQDSSI